MEDVLRGHDARGSHQEFFTVIAPTRQLDLLSVVKVRVTHERAKSAARLGLASGAEFD
jgi:hypothetical protein